MMRKMLAITLGLGLSGLLLEAAERGARPNQRPDRAAKLRQFDKDNDGKLNEAEREAARQARRAAAVKQFDKDGDGELTKKERQAMREARQRERTEFRAKRAERRGKAGKKGAKRARNQQRKNAPGK